MQEGGRKGNERKTWIKQGVCVYKSVYLSCPDSHPASRGSDGPLPVSVVQSEAGAPGLSGI